MKQSTEKSETQHDHGPDCGCMHPLFGLAIAAVLVMGGWILWRALT